MVAAKLASSGDGEDIRREARIGAGLHHPNVVTVFDVVVAAGVPWLVMEYLPARSLAEVLREDGPLPPRRAAHVGAQLATGLSAMHAKGMVHRDVTLGNVLVADDGTAKLADLGVAAWGEATLTGTAQNAGTPGYLAPEVRSGHPATSASDLFSLGMTLSAAVGGQAEADGRLADVLSVLADPSPKRRPTAEAAARLLATVADNDMSSGNTGSARSGDVLAVPRQIPAPTRDFVGRAGELLDLTRFVEESTVDDGSVLISTVTGGGGVGKVGKTAPE